MIFDISKAFFLVRQYITSGIDGFETSLKECQTNDEKNRFIDHSKHLVEHGWDEAFSEIPEKNDFFNSVLVDVFNRPSTKLFSNQRYAPAESDPLIIFLGKLVLLRSIFEAYQLDLVPVGEEKQLQLKEWFFKERKINSESIASELNNKTLQIQFGNIKITGLDELKDAIEKRDLIFRQYGVKPLPVVAAVAWLLYLMFAEKSSNETHFKGAVIISLLFVNYFNRLHSNAIHARNESMFFKIAMLNSKMKNNSLNINKLTFVTDDEIKKLFMKPQEIVEAPLQSGLLRAV